MRQTTYALGIDRSGVTAGRITTTACMAVQRDLYVDDHGVGDMGGFRLPSTWLVRF
ncbi:hypothetical protein [Nonomuraea sp. SYSU D8015]|uniref:hypothetical protein n=1 Tax=Nonomuraea sp. SYSU D8015 TaxID=2593644 RepID=UPI0016617BA5|nr:hypothetical protein [Nonomuraea sp. SYSU D8015]